MNWTNTKSAALFEANKKSIAGGVVSINRKIDPPICFRRGRGCRVWDEDDNQYIDYHAGFAPVLLGHNNPQVNAAVEKIIRDDAVHMGSGTTWYEGRLSELLVENIPALDSVQITNSGSEATSLAIRLARVHAGRNDVIVMQGGFNGSNNDLAYNVMNPLDTIGVRVSPGEYPRMPLSAGIPEGTAQHVHVINFNDLDSVRWVAEKYDIAALITEPILQNIGVVKPRPGYLQGLRELADEFGFVLIFDEVKTGFRHALGGYQQVCGVSADLSTWAKAMANGYPIGVIGGRRELMDLFDAPQPDRRVLIAGTYNAHPLPTAAAIATLEILLANDGEVYRHTDAMGQRLEEGLRGVFDRLGIAAVTARQGSAFCTYFMDHEPVDWHDIAGHHDFEFDAKYRLALVKHGIYHFPLPAKQGSISFAHQPSDIDETIEITERVLKEEMK